MAERSFVLQTNNIVTSFATRRPRALIGKVPWVITPETKLSDALSLIHDEGHADLLVLEPETGRVRGVLSDPERSTTISSKKKREERANEWLRLQSECRKQCDAECANRGGCKESGVADYGGKVGMLCVTLCRGDDKTVGDILNPPEVLPG